MHIPSAIFSHSITTLQDARLEKFVFIGTSLFSPFISRGFSCECGAIDIRKGRPSPVHHTRIRGEWICLVLWRQPMLRCAAVGLGLLWPDGPGRGGQRRLGRPAAHRRALQPARGAAGVVRLRHLLRGAHCRWGACCLRSGAQLCTSFNVLRCHDTLSTSIISTSMTCSKFILLAVVATAAWATEWPA